MAIITKPCPVDMAEFRAACRVSIALGQVNRWVFVTGEPKDAPANADHLRDEVTAIVDDALDGKATDIRVRVLSPGAPLPKLPPDLPFLHRSQCPFPTSTDGETLRVVIVEFQAPDIGVSDVAWPAHQRATSFFRFERAEFEPEDCPFQATWLLEQAITGDEGFTLSEDEKPPPGFLDRLAEGAKTTATAFALTQVALAALAGYVLYKVFTK